MLSPCAESLQSRQKARWASPILGGERSGKRAAFRHLARKLLGEGALAAVLVHEREALHLLVAQLVLLVGIVRVALVSALAPTLGHAIGQALADPPLHVVHAVHADAARFGCSAAQLVVRADIRRHAALAVHHVLSAAECGSTPTLAGYREPQRQQPNTLPQAH